MSVKIPGVNQKLCFLLLISSLLLVCVLLITSGCKKEETALIIERCVDQDNELLPKEFSVTVYAGEKENLRVKKWVYGQPLVFSMPGLKKTVQVPLQVSVDDADIIALPIAPVTVEPNRSRKIALRFFRPYKFNIQTADPTGRPIPDVRFTYGTASVSSDAQGRAILTLTDTRLHGDMNVDIQIFKTGLSPTSADAGKIQLKRREFKYPLTVTMVSGLPSRQVSVNVEIVHIINNQEQPLAGAAAYLGAQPLGNSDLNGQFSPVTIALQPNESRFLRVQKDGYGVVQILPDMPVRYEETQSNYSFKVIMSPRISQHHYDLIVDVRDANTMQSIVDAAIYLDNEKLGNTAANGKLARSQLTLAPGEVRTIRVEKPDYGFVRIEPGNRIAYDDNKERYQINVYLRAFAEPPVEKKISLRIVVKDSSDNSPLSGTSVFLNTQEIGKTDAIGQVQITGYSLHSGDVLRLSATKSGYRPSQQPAVTIRYTDAKSSYDLSWILTKEKASKNCERLAMLADAAAKRGQDRQAIDYYRQITSPVDAEEKACYISAMNELGLIYLKLKEFESSVNCFKAGLDLDFQDYGLHLNLAKTYFQSGNYDLADKQLTEVEKLKFVIPSQGGRRQEVLLNVRYIRALCEFGRYQNETDNEKREKLRVSTYRYFEDFMYQVPKDNEEYKLLRVDAEEKMQRLQGE